jgi:hypothetical protein
MDLRFRNAMNVVDTSFDVTDGLNTSLISNLKNFNKYSMYSIELFIELAAYMSPRNINVSLRFSMGLTLSNMADEPSTSPITRNDERDGWDEWCLTELQFGKLLG